ncbi:MAG TPA: MtnX-like HAD-IB family phosphatase [Firmicutes bacterium]|nr:MtnX-like HAD-IB family phosphatase [Bacillota bacterium]
MAGVDPRHVAVLCDFDGTIALDDVGDAIVQSFAAPGWEERLEMWRQGQLGSREYYEVTYSTLRVDRKGLEDFLGRFRLDPGFIDLVRYCRESGFDFAVVSDGFDFYISHILNSNGIPEVKYFSNSLSFEDGRIKIGFPHANPDCKRCGNCKLGVVRSFKKRGLTVVYIGDGLSDRYALPAADIVFAKGDLARHCDRNGIQFFHFEGLADVVAALRGGVLLVSKQRRVVE